MSNRASSLPRPHPASQPRATLPFPQEEPSPVVSPVKTPPAVPPDPFAQARRLWGHLLRKVHTTLLARLYPLVTN